MSISDPQNDTSSASRPNQQHCQIKPAVVPTQKNDLQTERIQDLQGIAKLSERQPFEALHNYLQSASPMHAALGPDLLNELSPVRRQNFTETLIEAKKQDTIKSGSINKNIFAHKFVGQSALQTSTDNDPTNIQTVYYETFIFEQKSIPTRCNWHDFYNGLIWLQFPQTKAYFNAQHHQQMQRFGAKNRTPVRDRLTHFDECGVVLVTNQSKLKGEISAHDWQRIFVERRHQWHHQIKPIIFGHALWEMLMQPFIGLTAKVTVIEDAQLLNRIEDYQGVPSQASAQIDNALLTHLKSTQLIEQKKPWMPLPLLGIPNWSHVPQTDAFYANTKYFMPKRSVVKSR